MAESSKPEAQRLRNTYEVAEYLGVHPKTVRALARKGQINYILVAGKLRFRPAAVELFLAQREVKTTQR